MNPLGLPAPATHHGMVGLDICAFGRRPAAHHPYLREALYRIGEAALTGIGVPPELRHQEDRGDAIVVIAPAGTSVELLLGPLYDRVRLGLRHHNRYAAEAARLRLRMAVDAGYVRHDPGGVSGAALVRMFRLLDAAEFKAAIDAHGSDLGLITSDEVHHHLIHDSPGMIDESAFTPIEIANKETTGPAWICLPPRPAADRPLVADFPRHRS